MLRAGQATQGCRSSETSTYWNVLASSSCTSLAPIVTSFVHDCHLDIHLQSLNVCLRFRFHRSLQQQKADGRGLFIWPTVNQTKNPPLLQLPRQSALGISGLVIVQFRTLHRHPESPVPDSLLCRLPCKT